MSLLVEPAHRHSGRDQPKTKPTKKPRKLTKADRAKREAGRARRQAEREAERARLAEYQNPNMVLTFKQWCALNTFSISTGKQILRDGEGPKVIQLTDKRIGIRIGDNADWQEARAR